MDSLTVLNQLKEYWFNNKCEDEFRSILSDVDSNNETKEIKSLDYIRDTFTSFSKKHGYTELNSEMVEIIINWGILMYLQIKDKLEDNEENV